MIASATSTKSKVTFLETVYPPISNQEAIWLKNDTEVEALLRQSDFYMIGGRAVFVKAVVVWFRFQAACSAGPAMGPPPPA